MAFLQKKVQIRNEHRIHIKRLMAEISGLTQGGVVTYVSYKTRNQPKPPTTSQNHPQPAKTTHNQPKPAKTSQNQPKLPKTS